MRTKHNAIATSKRRLSSRLEALTKGVLWFFIKTKKDMVVTSNPITVRIKNMTAVTSDHLMLITGKGRHAVLSPFDLCSCGHLVQLGELCCLLMEPTGHLMHSQQQDTVIVCLVPGGQR